MGEIVRGRIIRHDETGIIISAALPDTERSIKRQYEYVLIELQDGRTISLKQQCKAHAIIGEIAEWTGETPEWMKKHMKLEFMADRLKSLEKTIFSLSDCDVTTAREFISFLIDFVLRYDVPTKVPLIELCDDVERYVYACLVNKKCAVCGKKADLHHWKALGMGADRTKVYQIGWPVISLCREHHQHAHSHGAQWLTDEMHLVPVPLTKEIGKAYKLSKKALEETA